MNRAKTIEQHYSISHAARLCGLHRNTISVKISSREIQPVIRLSRTVVRIPASAIQRYLKNSAKRYAESVRDRPIQNSPETT